MRRLLFLFIFLSSLAGCHEDDSMTQTKLRNYLLLCPAGINACYDNCGTDNHIGSNPTGSQMAAFESCKGNCDTYCNLGYILLLSSSK